MVTVAIPGLYCPGIIIEFDHFPGIIFVLLKCCGWFVNEPEQNYTVADIDKTLEKGIKRFLCF